MDAPRTMVDADALAAFVGRRQSSTDEITPDLVTRFRAVLDLPQGDVHAGDEAPPGIHFCLMPGIVPTAGLREDGHPAASDFLPSPFPRRMWARGELRMLEPLRVGQTVERHSEIADVVLKTGRSGTLCFVTVRHTLIAGGETAIEERQDIVYRGMAGSDAAAAGTEPAPRGDQRRLVTPSAPLLFRYSAITFNSHRIHYDRSYSVEVERYPGLVVHGPLQATLLLQFAAELRGSAPRRFDFRSGAPLFDLSPFHLNARDAAAEMELWTAADGGPAAMTARAAW